MTTLPSPPPPPPSPPPSSSLSPWSLSFLLHCPRPARARRPSWATPSASWNPLLRSWKRLPLRVPAPLVHLRQRRRHQQHRRQRTPSMRRLFSRRGSPGLPVGGMPGQCPPRRLCQGRRQMLLPPVGGGGAATAANRARLRRRVVVMPPGNTAAHLGNDGEKRISFVPSTVMPIFFLVFW